MSPTAGGDWTAEELAAAQAEQDALIDRGICPWSGYTIARCQAVDICDCFLPRAQPTPTEGA